LIDYKAESLNAVYDTRTLAKVLFCCVNLGWRQQAAIVGIARHNKHCIIFTVLPVATHYYEREK